MNFEVIIDFDSVVTYEGIFKEEDNTFSITFKSFEEYFKFLKSPKPFFDPIMEDFLSPDEKKFFDYINNNLIKLTTILKNTIIEIHNLKNLNDLDIKKLPNQEMHFDLTNLTYLEIKELLSLSNWDNVYFNDRFNTMHLSTKEEMLIAFEKIDKIITPLKKLNLSPAELLFIIFDITRSRMYQEANKNESYMARDLNCVLNSSNIVCLGYANLFCSICSALGISAENLIWNHKQDGHDGHASIIAYINDDKYDIHGIFAFEPTWSKKENDNDESYLNNLVQAFIPLKLEIFRKEKMQLKMNDSSLFGKLKKYFERYQRLISIEAPESILKKEEIMMLDLMNRINTLIGKVILKKVPIKNKLDFFEQSISDLENGFDARIPIDTFEALTFQVRTIENSLNFKSNNFTEEEIISAIETSISFKRAKRTQELLRRIFEK